jgi:hypothetical protein
MCSNADAKILSFNARAVGQAAMKRTSYNGNPIDRVRFDCEGPAGTGTDTERTINWLVLASVIGGVLFVGLATGVAIVRFTNEKRARRSSNQYSVHIYDAVPQVS